MNTYRYSYLLALVDYSCVALLSRFWCTVMDLCIYICIYLLDMHCLLVHIIISDRLRRFDPVTVDS